MSPSEKITKEKISKVRKRLSSHRLANLSLMLIAPVLGLMLLVAAINARLLSPWFYLPGLPVFLSLVVWSARIFKLGQVSPTEAASALDGLVSGKDRFLTLASLPKELTPEQQRSVALLAQQGESFGAAIIPERDFPFQLSRETKYSLWSSPIFFICLIFLLLNPLQTPGGVTGTDFKSQQLAEELRELSRELNTLPSSVKDDLETLALVLEESGLQSEDAEDALMDAVEEVQTALTEEKPQEEEDIQQVNEQPRQEQQNPEQKQEQKQEQNQEQEQAESQQTKEQQEKDRQADGEKEEKKEADSAKQEVDAEERGQKEGEKSGSTGKQSGDGEQKGESAPSEGKDKAQDQKGEGGQNSSADGKGDGKSVGSQSKPVDQDQNAKENADQKNAPSGAGGRAGGKGQEQGSGGGDKERDAGAKEKMGGSQLSQAKEKLDEIQKEMEGKESNSGEKESSKNQSSEQQKAGQQQQKSEQGKQQDQQSAQNQQGQQGKGGEQSPDQPPSEQQQQQPGAHRPQDSPQDTKSQDKQGNSSTPREGDSRLADKAAAKNSPQGKDDRPTNVDDPQVPPRYTSSGDGKNGLDHSKVKQYTKIEVPQEEKILVRNVGGSDGKTYKNTSQASAKTKLGTEDFEKPKADQTKEKQAIPVEYQGLLR